MIGTIDIKLNAAHPNLPLMPFYAFIGSPSHVRVLNVPRAIGSWQLTAVYVTANYPDNTSRSVPAVKTAGVWSATLPASTVTGTSTNGFTVSADGVSEDGETTVTGYVLGKGDLTILDIDSTITLGETTYYTHLLDAVPETPHKGDLCLIDGAWQIYNGSSWVAFGGGGGDVSHADFANVAAVPDRFTMNDLKSTVNNILSTLKGNAALVGFALCAIVSGAALADITPQTATLGSLYNDSLVVTNVTGAATDPSVVSNIVEAMRPEAYSWSSPDEWMLTFTRGGSTSRVSTPVKPDYEGWAIISNEQVTTTYHRTAQTVPVTVDETSYATPNVTNWSVSSGAAISTAGLVTSDADGVYRVTAKAANGTRYGDVILQSDLIVVETNSYHAADVAGTGTKAVNDAALAKLNAATKIGTYTREGKTYSVYDAEKVYITKTGAGNVSEFAVSAHILGTAAHYGSYIRWLGTQTFTAPDGTTATVTKKKWYNLRDWALENGWSAAEIDAAGVSDIALVVCDGATAVPDGCIPYFMSPTTALTKYGNGQGLAAWKCSQFHDYALPVTLTNWRSNLDGYTGDTARYWVRADILSRLAEMGAQNYVQSGDSGKPTYIVDSSGRTIVVTANTMPNHGPDYVNGFYIIKAFVEAMGDTLKEAN